VRIRRLIPLGSNRPPCSEISFILPGKCVSPGFSERCNASLPVPRDRNSQSTSDMYTSCPSCQTAWCHGRLIGPPQSCWPTTGRAA
jgi:hypothetical protein